MEIKQLGMVGTGSMGNMMSLLFAEHGIEMHCFDPSEDNLKELEANATNASLQDRVTCHNDLHSLCEQLNHPKAFIFSTPHGDIADKNIEQMEKWLEEGDVIVDAGNEHWQKTERRQDKLKPKGIHYIGMGVSGGYQSARSGPSLSPGGTPEALDTIFPFLQKVAARDNKGRPCTAKVGPGGAGHYVKMVHNGIEHGMLTVLCEAFGILQTGLGLSYDDIGDVFEQWNKSGPLSNNFLIDIGSDICREKDPKDGSHVLSSVKDKIVQDYDNSEGTGTWSVEEAIRLHVPAPTLAVSHMFRIASADAAKRAAVQKAFGSGFQPSAIKNVDRDRFIKDLEAATYASFLLSFIQGLHLISVASDENEWEIDFTSVLQLWRGGCIIQSDFIVDLLEGVYRSKGCGADNLLSHPTIVKELQGTSQALKNVVLVAVATDAHVPALSASLEYLKYSQSTDLPTSFQEAQLDYFGCHMYDLKSDGPGEPVKGSHHYEWKPAQGMSDTKK